MTSPCLLALSKGTGGTVQGAGKAIKAARPEVKIVLSEPDGAQLIGSGVEQTRVEATGAPADTHPAFAPHPVCTLAYAHTFHRVSFKGLLGRGRERGVHVVVGVRKEAHTKRTCSWCVS